MQSQHHGIYQAQNDAKKNLKKEEILLERLYLLRNWGLKVFNKKKVLLMYYGYSTICTLP
jgi:hypothetical protein